MDSVRFQMLQACEDSGKYKDAAIMAFALAKRAQKSGDDAEALRLGRKCLELLGKYPTDTAEQCASPYITLYEVPIPGLFHEGTVRRNLAPLAL